MNASVMDFVTALKEVIQSIPALAGKGVFAYNEDDFMDKIAGLKVYPGVAIVYEGMRSMPETGTARIGLSAEIVFSLILIDQGDAVLRTDQRKVNSLTYLDDIRSKLMGTRSPSQHYWRFLVEAPAEAKKGMIFWVQRWSSPIQVSPTGRNTI